jgi:hypothetical protein
VSGMERSRSATSRRSCSRRTKKPHSLIIRVGTTFTHLLTIPIQAVEGVDPAGERVFVALTRHVDEPDQLPIPALAGR